MPWSLEKKRHMKYHLPNFHSLGWLLPRVTFTLKSKNALSLTCDISAVFAPILLQKPSFESSFASSFIIVQFFGPVVSLLYKILLYVGLILVYHCRCIRAQSQAFESAATANFRNHLMYDASRFADSKVLDFWPCETRLNSVSTHSRLFNHSFVRSFLRLCFCLFIYSFVSSFLRAYILISTFGICYLFIITSLFFF